MVLVYQMQTRIFKIENDVPFVFPASARIEVKFSPGSTFGTTDELSRTVVCGHTAHLHFNANAGKCTFKAEPPLERLDVKVHAPSTVFELDGDVARYHFPCESMEHLQGALLGLKWLLPPLLNLKFRDPPSVEYVRGTLGESKFRWEHHHTDWMIHFSPVTAASLEEHVAWSYQHLTLFNEINNRRLAAALCYFHSASRLLVSGDSPWEFMSEAILNLSKCLEILFVGSSDTSRDDLRRELASLGYSADEIDGDFIPIAILRNQLDVGHPRIALFKPNDLKVLYRYICDAEDRFRKMLCRLIDRVASKDYRIREATDLRLSAADQRGMDKLVETMRARSPEPGAKLDQETS